MPNIQKKYERYIKSPEWQRKKAERLELDENRCVMCGRPNGTYRGKPILQIHHISYAHLGNEPLSDLCSLCSGCHLKIHRYYNRPRDWTDKLNEVN